MPQNLRICYMRPYHGWHASLYDNYSSSTMVTVVWHNCSLYTYVLMMVMRTAHFPGRAKRVRMQCAPEPAGAFFFFFISTLNFKMMQLILYCKSRWCNWHSTVISRWCNLYSNSCHWHSPAILRWCNLCRRWCPAMGTAKIFSGCQSPGWTLENWCTKFQQYRG